MYISIVGRIVLNSHRYSQVDISLKYLTIEYGDWRRLQIANDRWCYGEL
jgi:hypothetical protein